MAYKKSSSCGGLRYSTTDFTEVDGVLTSATTKVDTYTPTYSTGVTAKFNKDKYIEAYEKKTTTFTATVVDTTTTWSDGTSTVADMSVVGLSDITGVVDGSTIKITYAEQTVPRTELVGDPFLASMCGGIWFDDGVFGEVGKAITTAGTSSVASSFAANCSLLFDASKFELGEDKEIKLLQTEKLPISWDGNTVGKEVATMSIEGSSTPTNFYKVSTNVFNRDDIINTTITLSNGQTIDLTEESTQEGEEGWVVIDNDYCAVSGEYLISAKAGTYVLENVATIVVPSDGIYFTSNNSIYVASLAETV